MSSFVAPVDVPEQAPGAFGTCECGCRIYDHGRMHKDGNEVWAGCRNCPDCVKFRASDGSQWPYVFGGPVPDEPTDLDRNSDHWIDGQVYLTTDEPPL